MKKSLVIVALLLAAACSKRSSVPSIQSFTADKTSVTAGDTVTLSFVVTGATSFTITPAPGAVTASPVTVNPSVTTTYTLRAANDAGAVTQDLLITVTANGLAARIASFTALPSQVPPGGQVTLTWSVSNAASISLAAGTGTPSDVTAVTQKAVTPSATTLYTLTVTGLPGTTPLTSSATVVARVAAASHIASFTASQTAINQGQQITLSWDGSATSWTLSDGTTTTNYGPLKSATVEPKANTTYTLTAMGVGGNDTKTLAITVTPQPGTKLVYTAPVVATQVLQLLADPCGACTSITFHLVAAVPTSLRGAALNVPLDSAKISLDPTTFAAPFTTDTPPAAAIALGTGPLKDTLVLGVAKKGSGTAVAADTSVPLGGEVAHFSLALVTSGGKGVVFDGSALAANANFLGRVQSASASALGAIAVGKLEVQ